MRAAGFKDAKIIKESFFPTGFSTTDPMVQSLVKEMGLTAADLEDAVASVISAEVLAFKPA